MSKIRKKPKIHKVVIDEEEDVAVHIRGMTGALYIHHANRLAETEGMALNEQYIRQCELVADVLVDESGEPLYAAAEDVKEEEDQEDVRAILEWILDRNAVEDDEAKKG